MTTRLVLRNLRKRPFLNLIKVMGLSLALSSLLLILVFLKSELSCDSYHSKADRLYRFTTTSPAFFSGKHFARTYGTKFLPEFIESFPAVESFVRLSPASGGVMKYKDNFHKINQAFLCDSTFFEVFDSDLLIGNPATVLDAPSSLVISESFARRISGEKNPIGQVLTLPPGQYNGEDQDYNITGIMKDFPRESHFHPEYLATPKDPSLLEGWAWTYLLLQENSDPGQISSGFRDFAINFYESNPDEFTTEAHMQAITNIHLHSKKTREIEANSSMNVIYSLALAAILLLCIALVNLANLNMGMAAYSDRFLFFIKVYGASRRKFLRYFLTEALFISLASLFITGLILALSNSYIKSKLDLRIMEENLVLLLIVTSIFSLTAILTGIIPLLRYSLRNIYSRRDLNAVNLRNSRSLSKGLIILQYAISTALVVAVFVIQKQTTYAMGSGMDSENSTLICLEDVHSPIQQQFSTFKNELLKHSSVTSVSAMFEPPGGEANDLFPFTMEGFVPDESRPHDNLIGIFPCDYSFATIFDLEFIAGENFSDSYSDNDGLAEYIINESAMHRLNYPDPREIIGKNFDLNFHNDLLDIPSGKITGVVKDFHHSSLKRAIDPLVLFKRKDLWLSNLIIGFDPADQNKALMDSKKVWETLFPGYNFEYRFVDAMYKEIYRNEILQSRLLALFTIIALFICSMGLLGLSLLSTRKRIREIGIRRVNGARTGHIMAILNWDFVKWILLAIALALPLAWLAMNRWLESYTYRIRIGWWIFVLAGFLVILIALLTISIQSWKAVKKNPVESLRYE